MKKTDIDRLLEGRQITEEYEQDYPTEGEPAKWAFVRKLQGIGFNSPKIFSDWNDQMNRQAFRECIIYDGQCDFCEGYGDEPPCYPAFRKGSPIYIYPCYEDKAPEEKQAMHLSDLQEFARPDKVHEVLFGLMRVGYAHADMDKAKRHGLLLCPPGHGFSLNPAKQKNLPFDIHWERR